ncbi:hypothetical protein RF11_04305 [Thelohanellus kitauei]|uniref:HAT C-terminal dimerisation domain-containing protein n=1 Tax=Thelohanellus kitauei TaxID=669202 RepID=A0A0C2NDG1_THEKT|nr:hypothetical protein RF11_04305 [Thelohanellus kitauei]
MLDQNELLLGEIQNWDRKNSHRGLDLSTIKLEFLKRLKGADLTKLKEFEINQKGLTKNDLACTHCGSSFLIAHDGRSYISDHVQSKKRKKAISGNSSKGNLINFFLGQSSTSDDLQRKFSSARTKTEAAVTDCIDRFALEEIVKDLDTSNQHATKIVPKVAAFSADKTNANFGSAYRKWRRNIYVNFETSIGRSELLGIVCSANILHNAMQTAADCLPFNVEQIVCKIYQHFPSYTDRVRIQETSWQLQNQVFSSYAFVENIWLIYDGLKKYFSLLPDCPTVIQGLFYNPLSKTFHDDDIVAIKYSYGRQPGSLKSKCFFADSKKMKCDVSKLSFELLTETPTRREVEADNGIVSTIARRSSTADDNRPFDQLLTETNSGQRWLEVLEHFKNEQVEFDEILRLLQCSLSLPETNAPIERVFSLMNDMWTNPKTQLTTETLRPLLTTTVNINTSWLKFYELIKSNN